MRDLLERDGCRDAARVGGVNDRGADVIATEPLGRCWVIQCKHRQGGLSGKPVGTPDLQVLNGTARQLHGVGIAVLLMNGRYTKGCLPPGQEPAPAPGRPPHAGGAGGRLPTAVGSAATAPAAARGVVADVAPPDGPERAFGTGSPLRYRSGLAGWRRPLRQSGSRPNDGGAARPDGSGPRRACGPLLHPPGTAPGCLFIRVGAARRPRKWTRRPPGRPG
ncbi:restriction endonuclease [Streptomyces sp. NBC_01497]|uniref:restriction endonuclease n=1 Tax=Streptomyces sp. NBC_01497 TaxID=2903885 RepID=UPI002E3692B4|nr:restriction endonuclease [Streptomyces sp. NBC_01497]